MKDFFLEANPNPDRIGCPDERTLRALAEDRLPPPIRLACIWLRALNVSPNSADSEEIGRIAESASPNSRLGTGRLFDPGQFYRDLGISVFGKAQIIAVQMAATDPVNANVDLFTAGTVRGEADDQNALKQVLLPAAIDSFQLLCLDSANPDAMKCLCRETNPAVMSWRRAPANRSILPAKLSWL